MQRLQHPGWRLVLALVLVLALAGGVIAAVPDTFEIAWFTVDSGGGSMSGSGYTIDGTIGQPDAASTSGGGYTLDGGFWNPQNAASSSRLFIPLLVR